MDIRSIKFKILVEPLNLQHCGSTLGPTWISERADFSTSSCS